jgi:hypothetical protein
MTLFFDTKAQFLDGETISTTVVFHPNESLFAVAGFNDHRGGSVTIFDDTVNFVHKYFSDRCITEENLILGRAIARHNLSKSSRESSNIACVSSAQAVVDFWLGKWRDSSLDQWKARICADSGFKFP